MKKRLHSPVAMAVVAIAVMFAAVQIFEIVGEVRNLEMSGVRPDASVWLTLGFGHLMDPVFLFCSAMMIEYLHRIWVALAARSDPNGASE